MPTYEYNCRNCDHEFELFQQMTAPVKRKCPECGRLTLQRLIGTGAGVLFKGNGFYETDYRSESYRKAARADKDAATGANGKSDSGKPDKTSSKDKASSDGKKKSPSAKAASS
ncbi:MAG: zinc ribbon domain-containing protein [Phycisphaerales bacterium]|nr:MAG: zinc ribbon domain-containing protein [Phycisphaerales bacterium]